MEPIVCYLLLFRTDLYSEEPITLCDVKFEQAGILHNLGVWNFELFQTCIFTIPSNQ